MRGLLTVEGRGRVFVGVFWLSVVVGVAGYLFIFCVGFFF